MGKAFDIQRRSRTQPTAGRRDDPDVRRARQSGFWFFALLGLGLILLIANQQATSDANRIDQPSDQATANPTSKDTPTVTVTATVSPSPTASSLSPAPPTPLETNPTVTETPIAKGAIKMTILNGSGTPGKANELRKELEKAGFSVRSIAVAKNQREDTIIYYQTGKKREAELVKEFIQNRTVALEENNELTGSDDLLIIVGKS